MPFTRDALLRVALLALSLGLVLGVGELAARLSWRDPELREVPPRRRDLPVLRSVRELSQPNVRGLHKGVLYRTNSRGLRGPEYPEQAAPGIFRIAVTGDSVTVGSGVDEEHAYARQLETLLNRGRDRPRFEVINMGLGGINASQAIARLEKNSAVYAPDLVVYGFTLNDLEGAGYIRLRPPESHRKLWFRSRQFQESPSYLLRVVWPRLVAMKERLLPTEGTIETELHHNYFENPAAWERFTRVLDRYADYAREQGVCAHLFVHTSLEFLDFTHPYRDIYARVAEAARERGLSVSQSFPAVRGEDAAELWVNYFDSHPNEKGHALFAAALFEGLGALPDSCWRRRGLVASPHAETVAR